MAETPPAHSTPLPPALPDDEVMSALLQASVLADGVIQLTCTHPPPFDLIAKAERLKIDLYLARTEYRELRDRPGVHVTLFALAAIGFACGIVGAVVAGLLS